MATIAPAFLAPSFLQGPQSQTAAPPVWGVPVGNTTDMDVLLSMTDLFDFSSVLSSPPDGNFFGGVDPGFGSVSPALPPAPPPQLPMPLSGSPYGLTLAPLPPVGLMAPATASMLADASAAIKADGSGPPALSLGSFARAPAAAEPAATTTTTTRRRTSNKEEQQRKRRERNRVLARKTRLRKKFFFSSLQKQVRQLATENKELKDIVRTHCGERGEAVLQECRTEIPAIIADTPSSATALLDKSDFLLMKALQNSQPSFCVTDPLLPDNPIVFASDGFIESTGYTRQQVLGRNCRFLQGPDTDPDAVAVIRKGIEEGRDTNVLLKNYKADGTAFWNHVFVAALRDENRRIINYVGIQHVVNYQPRPEVIEQIKRDSMADSDS